MKNWIINLAVGFFVKKIISKGISNQELFDLGVKAGKIISKKGMKVGGKNFNLVENEIQKKFPFLMKGLNTGLDFDD